ncbi:hypothetical protein D3C85_1931330 [compost metagenome]
MVEQELVADPVELVRRDAGADVFADLHDGLRRDPAGNPDFLDGLGGLYLRTGELLRTGPAHILGAGN